MLKEVLVVLVGLVGLGLSQQFQSNNQEGLGAWALEDGKLAGLLGGFKSGFNGFGSQNGNAAFRAVKRRFHRYNTHNVYFMSPFATFLRNPLLSSPGGPGGQGLQRRRRQWWQVLWPRLNSALRPSPL